MLWQKRIQPEYYFKEASYVYEREKDYKHRLASTMMVICALVDYGLKEVDEILKDRDNNHDNKYYEELTKLKIAWGDYFAKTSKKYNYSVRSDDLADCLLLSLNNYLSILNQHKSSDIDNDTFNNIIRCILYLNAISLTRNLYKTEELQKNWCFFLIQPYFQKQKMTFISFEHYKNEYGSPSDSDSLQSSFDGNRGTTTAKPSNPVVSAPSVKRDSLPNDLSLNDTININKLSGLEVPKPSVQPASIPSEDPDISLGASFMPSAIAPTGKKYSSQGDASLQDSINFDKLSRLDKSRVTGMTNLTQSSVPKKDPISTGNSFNSSVNVDKVSGGKSKPISASKRYPMGESIVESNLSQVSFKDKGTQSVPSSDIPETKEIMSNVSHRYPTLDIQQSHAQSTLHAPSSQLASSAYKTVYVHSPSNQTSPYGGLNSEPPLPPNPINDPLMMNNTIIPPEIATPSVPSYSTTYLPGPPIVSVPFYSPPTNSYTSDPTLLIDSVIKDLRTHLSQYQIAESCIQRLESVKECIANSHI